MSAPLAVQTEVKDFYGMAKVTLDAPASSAGSPSPRLDVLGTYVPFYTSCNVLADSTADGGPLISALLSGAVQLIEVSQDPFRFLIPKSGVTSSVTVRCFGMKSTQVLSHPLPRASTQRSGQRARLPSTPCVVFSGNVEKPGGFHKAYAACSAMDTRT